MRFTEAAERLVRLVDKSQRASCLQESCPSPARCRPQWSPRSSCSPGWAVLEVLAWPPSHLLFIPGAMLVVPFWTPSPNHGSLHTTDIYISHPTTQSQDG